MATLDPRFLAPALLLAASAVNAQVHISAIKGDASIRHGDAGSQATGAVNTPLQTDDHIVTSPNARVDIEFDSTNTFRIGASAELRLLAPASGKYQTALIKGALTYSVAGPSPKVTVDTPSVSVRPSDEGVYRIAINAARESEITVHAGQVEIFAASGSEWISAGQKMIARGSPSDPEFKIVSAVSRWRRAAKVLLSSMQIGGGASFSNSDERSSSRDRDKDKDKDRSAPKPASKATPVTASNGNDSKPTPSRGSFSPAQSSSSHHSSTHEATPTPSAHHSAPAAQTASNSSHSSSNNSSSSSSSHSSSSSSSSSSSHK